MLNRMMPLVGATLMMATTAPIIFVSPVSARGVFNVPDNQVYPVLERLQRNSRAFRLSFDRALDRSRLNNTYREDELNSLMREFEKSVTRLEQQFVTRQRTVDDVNIVLTRGSRIDLLMPKKGDVWYQANQDWLRLRQSLQDLARITYGTQFPVPLANNNGQGQVFSVPSNQVYTVLDGLQRNTRTFRVSFDRALDRSRINNTYREDQLNAFLLEFERSVNRLESQYATRQPTADDVKLVLNQGTRIDRIMPKSGEIWYQANQDWARLRQSLQELARVTYNTQFPAQVQYPYQIR